MKSQEVLVYSTVVLLRNINCCNSYTASDTDRLRRGVWSVSSEAAINKKYMV